MDSKRLKFDARTYMKEHPGTSYQEALRAITAVGTQDSTQPDQAIDLMTALGIGDVDKHDFAEV